MTLEIGHVDVIFIIVKGGKEVKIMKRRNYLLRKLMVCFLTATMIVSMVGMTAMADDGEVSDSAVTSESEERPDPEEPTEPEEPTATVGTIATENVDTDPTEDTDQPEDTASEENIDQQNDVDPDSPSEDDASSEEVTLTDPETEITQETETASTFALIRAAFSEEPQDTSSSITGSECWLGGGNIVGSVNIQISEPYPSDTDENNEAASNWITITNTRNEQEEVYIGGSLSDAVEVKLNVGEDGTVTIGGVSYTVNTDEDGKQILTDSEGDVYRIEVTCLYYVPDRNGIYGVNVKLVKQTNEADSDENSDEGGSSYTMGGECWYDTSSGNLVSKGIEILITTEYPLGSDNWISAPNKENTELQYNGENLNDIVNVVLPEGEKVEISDKSYTVKGGVLVDETTGNTYTLKVTRLYYLLKSAVQGVDVDLVQLTQVAGAYVRIDNTPQDDTKLVSDSEYSHANAEYVSIADIVDVSFKYDGIWTWETGNSGDYKSYFNLDINNGGLGELVTVSYKSGFADSSSDRTVEIDGKTYTVSIEGNSIILTEKNGTKWNLIPYKFVYTVTNDKYIYPYHVDYEMVKYTVSETPTTPTTPTNDSTPSPSGSSDGGTNDDEPSTDITDEAVSLAEIIDEAVPLAEILDEDVPLAEILDEDVPLAEIPKTGDDSNLWMALMLLSGLGLAGIMLKDKREKAHA